MRTIVVDCKGHLKGRLASVVAKQLLKGQHIVLVRCEEANVSGSFFRNKILFMQYLHKTMRHNPARGHVHYRAPSMMIYKAVRGMLPHKSTRGQEALKRLKVFDGVPPKYQKVKRMVIPDALRVLNLKAESKYTRLGDLASQVGWKYAGIISKLEKERLAKSKAYYYRKQKAIKMHAIQLRKYRRKGMNKVRDALIQIKKAEMIKKDPEAAKRFAEKKAKRQAEKAAKKARKAYRKKILEKVAAKKGPKKLSKKEQKRAERKAKKAAKEAKKKDAKKDAKKDQKKVQKKVEKKVEKKGAKKGPKNVPKKVAKKAPKAVAASKPAPKKTVKA
ncbi:putative 60S ribosomal protein L13a-1 [Monocercomonoides exilis]|uniref:putative 60S ribosomal protein L13a-1 n=1 Tax=Monocercomonoides exilis TaxID=2049356 RepID=UPI00355A57AD|nr:putative 60S ribosomal protein L13a-1 [Monocercomonoides exilis]|eukprot:MONOS_1943.1-p1 / transcript=MONOS_1943.1 / gene=MONOS_1943 / organism=Monocercomonoides_exilis_PA203 / gene_product=60S ribosomal protein L13a-1 / transcript_product=60S ribosomal protein L13a-1 / location=Mono_scaffold00037:92852-94153(-) / protein_length=331 / sequence_SO=supercontig / SO=protein_coding / is_pseudo=false